jgi:hypothetical protein
MSGPEGSNELHHITLFALYEFAAEHFRVPLREIGGTYADRKKFNSIIDTLVFRAPTSPGWYLWGRFFDCGWRSIYIGKAGNRVRGIYADLRTRIREELKDEKAFIWVSVFGFESIARQWRNLPAANAQAYPNGNMKRHVLKLNTHYIVWNKGADDITEEEIRLQEKQLIRHYCPTANRNPSTQQVRAQADPLSVEGREESKVLHCRLVQSFDAEIARIVCRGRQEFDTPNDGGLMQYRPQQ